ncbi:uncharacterized protein LOC18438185 [Amborella trichopoda]|uniref:Uncharacterized protein n=1 Tax=Amborella trichopoda TaxID=13333 RepID=W1PPM2_AMBTC|nr:uncharacterized protein LOC18438185 [Amborella trichopoda]ERN10018.1 hypothetical protein AMTR_s00013p00238320 [Amborella trichopoda]|eukprot:XP_020525564.1 uncharacterized protein LOC18438185 [Amborella trichopoda]
MGGCVSLRKRHDSSMKLHISMSNNNQKVLFPVDGNDFFNSMDRRGDFTPYRGSFSHPSSNQATPRTSAASLADQASIPKPSASPLEKKKLSDFFRVKSESEIVVPETPSPLQPSLASNLSNGEKPLESIKSTSTEKTEFTNMTPLSERHASLKDHKEENEKRVKAKASQCCLPSLVRNVSFGEKKKLASPNGQIKG